MGVCSSHLIIIETLIHMNHFFFPWLFWQYHCDPLDSSLAGNPWGAVPTTKPLLESLDPSLPAVPSLALPLLAMFLLSLLPEGPSPPSPLTFGGIGSVDEDNSGQHDSGAPTTVQPIDPGTISGQSTPTARSNPTKASREFPLVVPEMTGLPSGIIPTSQDANAVITSVAILSVEPSGMIMPVLQTVVLPSEHQATKADPPSLHSISPVVRSALPGQLRPSDDGAGLSGVPSITPPSTARFTPNVSGGAVSAGSTLFTTGKAAGANTTMFIMTSNPTDGAVVTDAPGGLPLSYCDLFGDCAQISGRFPSYDAT